MTSAASAKSLQSCPTLCNPIDGSPPGSPIPGILQARVLEWGAIASSVMISRYHQLIVMYLGGIFLLQLCFEFIELLGSVG